MSEELVLDRRSSERRQLAATIIVRPIGGFTYQVQVDDLSAGGCRVELIEAAELGETMITRFPDLEPLAAQLRWMSGARAGLQFPRNIHPAVLDALVARLAVYKRH